MPLLEEIHLNKGIPRNQTLALCKSHDAPQDSKVVVDGCRLYTLSQPRFFEFINTRAGDIRQSSPSECGFQLPDGRPISLAGIRVRHFCKKRFGPFSKRRWDRSWQVKTIFEYFGLPARNQPFGEALIRCVRALA